MAAIDMCRRNRIPLVVFNLKQPGRMRAVVQGTRIGTLIDAGPPGPPADAAGL